MKLTIVNASCESMHEISDESIACIFTSPPYAIARDYGEQTEGNIGSSQNESLDAYGKYLEMMENVFKECYRVLTAGRYIGINIADIIQYDKATGYNRKAISFDYHNIMVRLGFNYRDTILWKKPDGVQTQKRFGVVMQTPYPLYYAPNNVYEPIMIYRKPGRDLAKEKQSEKNRLDLEELKEFQTDIWTIPPETNVKHPAPFPWKLPWLFFKLYAYEGETVLDPFVGSGSSMMAARKLKMDCIGYEIEKTYIPLIHERVGVPYGDQKGLSDFGFGVAESITVIERIAESPTMPQINPTIDDNSKKV